MHTPPSSAFLSTGLALVPVALGSGEPVSEIQAPMASEIIFGLITSTALNMVVVPAAYFALSAKGTSERSVGAV